MVLFKQHFRVNKVPLVQGPTGITPTSLYFSNQADGILTKHSLIQEPQEQRTRLLKKRFSIPAVNNAIRLQFIQTDKQEKKALIQYSHIRLRGHPQKQMGFRGKKKAL